MGPRQTLEILEGLGIDEELQVVVRIDSLKHRPPERVLHNPLHTRDPLVEPCDKPAQILWFLCQLYHLLVAAGLHQTGDDTLCGWQVGSTLAATAEDA